jgi:hypothetical protein
LHIDDGSLEVTVTFCLLFYMVKKVFWMSPGRYYVPSEAKLLIY